MYNNLEEIDSSESYFKKIIINEEILVIAYINLGISNHMLNETQKNLHIDRSYLICTDIDYLKVNNNIIINKNNESSHFYLGGYDLDNKISEIEIKSNNLMLKILSDTIISDYYWTPIDTPNFKKNIDDDKLLLFFGS